MAAESYSFSPQFATIRSESPLAGMRPVASIQHTALSFKADEPFKIRSSGEELVGLGAIEGVNKGVGAALEGITTAYVSAKEAKAKKEKEDLDRGASLEIARLRSKSDKTEAEKQYEDDLKTTRLKVLKNQLKKEDNDEPIDYGTLDDPDVTAGEDLDNLAPSGQEMWNLPSTDLQAEPIDWNLSDIPLAEQTSIGPTPQEVQNLWSKTLSELTAATPAGAGQAAQLAAMQAGQIPVPSQDMSTDVQAQVRPLTPAYDLTAKYKGLVSPEQAQGLREQFYKATGEQMTGLGQPSLANMPTPVAQARKEAPQATTQNLGSYLKTWADPEVAAKAQQKISEIMGSSYAPAEIEEITTKTGERGFKVKYPKKLSAKELFDQKKAEKESRLQAPEMSKEQNAILLAQIGKLEQNKVYQKALETSDSKDTIFAALDKGDGFSDITAINAFQRLIDPGVAVREGDVALIQSAIAFSNKYSPEYIKQQFTKGSKLPPEDREKMRVLTKQLTRMALEKANKGPIEKFRKLTEKTGIDPDLIAIPFDIEVSSTENLAQQIKAKTTEMQGYPMNSNQRIEAAKELSALTKQLSESRK